MAYVSTEALQTIARLDTSAEDLSMILERKVAELTDKGENVTMEERAEVEAILRVLEVVANEKIALAIQSYDYIDHNIKAVDMEINLVERALRDSGVEIPTMENIFDGDSRRPKAAEDSAAAGVDASAEPVYCTCKRVAFGEMIACDNEDCPVEWFHYTCVNLTRKPRNSWICPLCSNKRKK